MLYEEMLISPCFLTFYIRLFQEKVLYTTGVILHYYIRAYARENIKNTRKQRACKSYLCSGAFMSFLKFEK